MNIFRIALPRSVRVGMFGIGGFQRGVLAVLQHDAHNGGIIAELFQNIGVGGPAGLGLLPVGQAQLAEEDLPQLLGRVDVEALPREVVDLLLQGGGLPGEHLSEGRESPLVHPAARQLHLRQDPAEGQLRRLKELPLLPLLQQGGQGLIEGVHRADMAVEGGLRRGGIPQEGEGVRAQVGRSRQLPVEVGGKEGGQVILAGGGVNEIGGKRRIKGEALGGQAVFQ